MNQLYPLVCSLSPEDATTHDEKPGETAEPLPADARQEEPMADLPKEIWTKPLTQREWEVACGLIMHWAMHGGC